MSFQHKHILITGASGGIGRHICQQLLQQGARLTMVARESEALQDLAKDYASAYVLPIVADITKADDRIELVQQGKLKFGNIDTLINLAGINSFGAFAEQDPLHVQATMEVNIMAPMLLTQLLLPAMITRNSGHIVNIGSTFGSIAFAWFTAYSASKFALRGFSQALRRELADTGIKVSYIAPRAVKTKMNSQAIYEMAKEVNMNMDEPVEVAQQIVMAIAKQKKEHYIGFPESLFVHLNSLLPGLIDSSLCKQDLVTKQYALR